MIHSSIAGNVSYHDTKMVICKLGNVQVGSDSLGKQTMLHAHVKLVLHSTRKGEQTSAKTDTGEMVAIASGYTHGTALLEQSRAI